MVFSWIGVGFSKPNSATALTISGRNPDSWNVFISDVLTPGKSTTLWKETN
jgi:hypothetical protein